MREEVEEMKRLRAEGKLWPTVKPGYLPEGGVEEKEDIPEPELRFENFITENGEMKEETEQPKKRRGCPPGGWPKKNPAAEKPSKRKYTRRAKASPSESQPSHPTGIDRAIELLTKRFNELTLARDVVGELVKQLIDAKQNERD